MNNFDELKKKEKKKSARPKTIFENERATATKGA